MINTSPQSYISISLSDRSDHAYIVQILSLTTLIIYINDKNTYIHTHFHDASTRCWFSDLIQLVQRRLNTHVKSRDKFFSIWEIDENENLCLMPLQQLFFLLSLYVCIYICSTALVYFYKCHF